MMDIQKLYRKNPKQAMQEINQEPPPLRCQIPTQDVQAHFVQQGSSVPNVEDPGPPPFGSWPVTEDGGVMDRELTQQEVKEVLKKMPHQSHLAQIMSPIHTGERWILRQQWSPRSWRPVEEIRGSQNTIYKLYSAVIGKRLSSWAQYNIFSPSQKGFPPCEGCLEHNFLLSSVLQDSRRRRAPVCITWLDISNAFQSVPHGVLMEMLSRTGVGPHTRDIVKDIYTGSTMCVRTGNGLTAPIPCNKGVRQGCPSPQPHTLQLRYGASYQGSGFHPLRRIHHRQSHHPFSDIC